MGRSQKDTRAVRYSADEGREWLWTEGTREKTRVVIHTYRGVMGKGTRT